MRCLSLLCFVGCLLLVKSKSIQDPSEISKNHTDATFNNRQNLATGYGGVLTPLDPFQIDTPFTMTDETLFGQVKDIIHHATFKGLTSFDQIHNVLNKNGSYVFQAHVPKIEVVGNYSTEPGFLGVPGGIFSATLNDVSITVAGVLSKDDNGINTVSNIHVQVKFGAPTTKVTIQGENVSEEYVKIFTPFLAADIGPLLTQASETYQFEISQFVTNYTNKLEKLYHETQNH